MEGSAASAENVQRLNPRGVYASLVYDNLSNIYWQEGRYDEGLQAGLE